MGGEQEIKTNNEKLREAKIDMDKAVLYVMSEAINSNIEQIDNPLTKQVLSSILVIFCREAASLGFDSGLEFAEKHGFKLGE